MRYVGLDEGLDGVYKGGEIERRERQADALHCAAGRQDIMYELCVYEERTASKKRASMACYGETWWIC